MALYLLKFFPSILLLLVYNYSGTAHALLQNQRPYCSVNTSDTTFKNNLHSLLTSIATVAQSNGGYFNDTVGTSADQIYGLGMCYASANLTTCNNCLSTAASKIIDDCPYSKDAGTWLESGPCFIRYSNENFFGVANTTSYYIYSSENYTERELFGNALLTARDALFDILIANVSANMVATGQQSVNGIDKLYGLLQCTRDLNYQECYKCLSSLISELQPPSLLAYTVGLRYFGFSCYVNYEMFPIMEQEGIPSDTSPAQENAVPVVEPGGRSRRLIIIISVSVALLIIVCFIIFLLIRKMRYAETEISQEEKMLTTNNEALDLWSRERSSDFPLFDFNQIADATGNFSLDNKLGEGGFGPVYKGVLQDGLEIAVKRLSSYSGQGLVEFKNEIQLIAKLQHRNLVRLVGWCIQGVEKILIYEFMPNKSLDYFIFDKTRGELVNWERRFEIIEGIAQGLLYLHKHSRLRIVHRDLKASNILLDSEMNPKISDFGLARIFSTKELQANTNRVVGTYGYMAPEYASEGLFSIKTDVFSFGVLLLEIVSSKRNTSFHQYGDFLNLLGYAWDRWKGGNIAELISPVLTEVPYRQIERCIHVALLCVQENPADRPTMSDVIVFLTTASIILPDPKQPAYFNVRVTEKGVLESCSINDVTLTNPEGR
ncbi:cysteine-rich receptor-like protein kinase 10 [Carex rostrata]